MMAKEKWAPIEGFEGIYDVSTFGRVRSYPRNGTQDKDVHILKHGVSKSGYHRYYLFKNGIGKNRCAHRLVAQTFIPNPEHKREVNHIDGNPSNNHVENLEWCTSSENHIHRVYTLGHNPLEKCRKVRCEETGEIYGSARAAAQALGRDHKGIVRAARGQYSQAYGFHWSYIN